MTLLHKPSDAAPSFDAADPGGAFSFPRRSVTWREPPDIVLDEAGVIQKCSKSFEVLFGYRSADLSEQHISMLFPQLSLDSLFKDGHFSPKLDFLCRCGHRFLAHDGRGHTFKSELSFVRIRTDGHRRVRLIVRPVADRGAHAAR